MPKKRVTFTVEEDIAKAFNESCKDRAINMSAWIEKQMYLLIKKEVVK